jgi:hypothetical protein
MGCLKGGLQERNFNRELKPQALRVLGVVGYDTSCKLSPTLNSELWPAVARREMKKLHSDITRFVHDGAKEFSAQNMKDFLQQEGIDADSRRSTN